jgi:spermidine synthase
MSIWFDETFKSSRFGLKVTRTLFSAQSPFQKVDIFETEELGRVMTLDDAFMTSEGDEFFYHELLTHPAMLTAEAPERVLVIGGGDGGTVREVLRHASVTKCVMIEIDELVVRACMEHLPTIGTAWKDPRLEVRFADGVDYVKNSDEAKYDVVLLDGTDPIGPGEVLFDLEFFRACKRMLKPDGVLALQSETPLLMSEAFFETQVKLRTLFSKVAPYLGPVPLYPSGLWSWTWCSDTRDPFVIDEARAKGIVDQLRWYNLDVHRGAFAQPNYVKRGIADRVGKE